MTEFDLRQPLDRLVVVNVSGIRALAGCLEQTGAGRLFYTVPWLGGKQLAELGELQLGWRLSGRSRLGWWLWPW